MSKKINKDDVERLQNAVAELENKITAQKELYDNNIAKYSSIISYYKEIFNSEDNKISIKTQIEQCRVITENCINNINRIEKGEDNSLSLEALYETITKLHSSAQSNEKIIAGITEFKTKYETDLNNKLTEVNDIKNDLKTYRDSVVGGSLFKTYASRTEKNDKSTKYYSIFSLACLVLSAGILGVLVFKEQHNYIVPSSISIILLTASFVSSSKSKVYHKLAEEYAYKTTLLESFVGYREQYKQSLDDREYNQFFTEVINAIKTNPSEKIDKLLHFKFPFEKALDVANNTAESIKNSVQSIK